VDDIISPLILEEKVQTKTFLVRLILARRAKAASDSSASRWTIVLGLRRLEPADIVKGAGDTKRKQ
jgi:hypothetical protein